MRKRLAVLGLMLVAGLLSMGAKPAKPMYMPAPIAVPEASKLESVVNVVRSALVGRGWLVRETTTSEDGTSAEVNTTLAVRIHGVTLKFLIDAKSIRIEYVSSHEMRYREKDGRKYIHPKYTTWVRNLELDINAGLVLLKSD